MDTNIMSILLFGSLTLFLLMAIIIKIDQYVRYKRIERRVVGILKEKNKKGYSFISTIALSNELNIIPKKIRDICYKSPRIRRNIREKECWTLLDVDVKLQPKSQDNQNLQRINVTSIDDA